jgi:hypothetical protein
MPADKSGVKYFMFNHNFKNNSNKFLTLLAITIATSLIMACTPRGIQISRMNFEPQKTYKLDEITNPDKLEIINIIKSQTDEEIIWINAISAAEIEVMTGVIRGPLDGGGNVYILKFHAGKWILFDDGSIRSWVS